LSYKVIIAPDEIGTLTGAPIGTVELSSTTTLAFLL
jgi:hypothetical protein